MRNTPQNVHLSQLKEKQSLELKKQKLKQELELIEFELGTYKTGLNDVEKLKQQIDLLQLQIDTNRDSFNSYIDRTTELKKLEKFNSGINTYEKTSEIAELKHSLDLLHNKANFSRNLSFIALGTIAALFILPMFFVQSSVQRNQIGFK